MKDRPVIKGMEIRQFEYRVDDVEMVGTHVPTYKKGSFIKRKTSMIRVFTDIGITGEYLASGRAEAEMASIYKAFNIIRGRCALDRGALYAEVDRVTTAFNPGTVGLVDMVLWDIAGKFYDAPVCELLGLYRTSLPAYASTFLGDREPDGLSSPEAYADFAEQCLEMGYKGFKTHLWDEADIDEWVATNNALGKRVGGKMDLMIDGACAIRTFGNAVKLGRSCDDNGFFWWEDPFWSATSAFAHRKLRQLVKTPLLQGEYERGLENHVDYILADGTDFIRADVLRDGGITGVMKLAHAAEGLGLDVEIHVPGPAERQLMAAIRNSNYYELALVHPKTTSLSPRVYIDYSDELDSIDKNGCVEVPRKPGMGVEYDWDYINKNTTSVVEY